MPFVNRAGAHRAACGAFFVGEVDFEAVRVDIFNPGFGKTPQLVTVTAVDDDIVDLDISYFVQLSASSSSDPLYNVIDPLDVSVTNNNDDLYALTIVESGSTIVSESGTTTDTFTVELASQPAGDVPITINHSFPLMI